MQFTIVSFRNVASQTWKLQGFKHSKHDKVCKACSKLIICSYQLTKIRIKYAQNVPKKDRFKSILKITSFVLFIKISDQNLSTK